MQEPADIWKPALIAGAIFGTWSGIPFLNIVNCACCSLIVAAGALTCYLMVRSGGLPVTLGRAALAGAVSGAVTSPVSAMTSVLVMAAFGRSYEENFHESLDRAAEMFPAASEAADMVAGIPPMVFLFASMVAGIFIYAPFGALGGIIGRAIFEKRSPAPETPAPTDPAQGGSAPPAH